MPRIRPETVLLKARMKALAKVNTLPASFDKRFIKQVCAWPMPTTIMTERQKMMVERLAWRYRRQIPSALVPSANPGPMPDKAPR